MGAMKWNLIKWVGRKKRAFFGVGCVIVLMVGLYFRSAGLWRGLDHGSVCHPDASKQVLAIHNYLQDEKIWYKNSLLYDGYPYGLNVLDQQVISAIYAVIRPVTCFLNPAVSYVEYPSRTQLHYWATLLRVLYGVGTLFLTMMAAGRLTNSRSTTLLVGVMAAIAPLSSTVTHNATGDIGVDLFLTLMFLALTLHSRHREGTPWAAVALAGLLAGMAFACKYQGALGLFVVGAYLLLATDLTRLRLQLRMVGAGVVTLLSAVAGAFLITPALQIQPKSAWRNIRANFEFIQNYNVPQEFTQLPVAQKIRLGLFENIPLVVDALGGMLIACCLIGLGASARQWWILRNDPQAVPARRHAALILSIALFPLFAVVVSTALKRNVQPFHFSYIVPPLCVMAGIGIRALSASQHIVLRMLSVLLLAGTLLQLGQSVMSEHFFWKREDLRVAENCYALESFRRPLDMERRLGSRPDNVLKTFRVESAALPVFRNKATRILHPAAAFWRSIHVLPGPTIPLGDDSSWIILDGPVLPRDDRTFVVSPHRTVERNIVVYDPVPDLVTLGIRSGSLPIEVSIEGLDEQQTCKLDADSQTLLQIPTRGGRRIPDHNGALGGLIVTLRCRVSLGSAWVSVMTDPRELENFALTGGTSQHGGNPILQSIPLDQILARASETAFLSCEQLEMPLTTNATSLIEGGLALPAGRYVLKCLVEGQDATNMVTLSLSGAAGWPDTVRASNTVCVGKKPADISFEFDKPFAPYEVRVLASCPTGHVVLKGYQLQPDTGKIMEDIQIQRNGGPVASWMRTRPAFTPMEERAVNAVSFDSILSLISFSMPLRAAVGETIGYNFRFDIQNYRALDVANVGVFVHVKDVNGKMACNLDMPLAWACFNTAPMIPVFRTLPADLLPGQYEVCMGLFTTGARKRWAIETGRYGIAEHTLTLGTLNILPRTALDKTQQGDGQQ